MVYSPLEKRKKKKKSLVLLIVGGVLEKPKPHTYPWSHNHPHLEGPQGLIHPRFPRVLDSNLSMCWPPLLSWRPISVRCLKTVV